MFCKKQTLFDIKLQILYNKAVKTTHTEMPTLIITELPFGDSVLI